MFWSSRSIHAFPESPGFFFLEMLKSPQLGAGAHDPGRGYQMLLCLAKVTGSEVGMGTELSNQSGSQDFGGLKHSLCSSLSRNTRADGCEPYKEPGGNQT